MSGAFEAALDLHRRGRLAEAEAAYARLLESDPDHVDALLHLGILHAQRGEPARAEPPLARACARAPADLRCRLNHGAVLQRLGRAADALAAFDAALAVEPQQPDALFNRGCALAALGRPADALAAFDAALALRPDDPEALVNRANALGELQRHDEALAAARRALALAPDAPPALDAEGRALRALRRTEEALARFERAAARAPRDAGFAFNRAGALLELGRNADALAGFERATALAPGRIDALAGRGHALKALGRLDAATEAFRAALAAPAPDAAARAHRDNALSQLAWLARETCAWAAAAEAERALLARVAEGNAVVDPFTVIGATDDRALQREAARGFWARRRGTRTPMARPPRPPGERIRVGYVGAEFRSHPVAYVVAGLFEAHDRARFEVLGYSYGPDDGSAIRKRIAAGFDRFAELRAETPEAIARRIAADGVDVLVDLAGHTAESRGEVLALRPAPVAAHFLGFPGSLGSDSVDYAIVDEVVVPPADARFFDEKPVWLPPSYQVNDRSRPRAARVPSRAECGLPEGAVVFCCFNNNFKFAAPVFDVWMRLLRDVPGSVLWLYAANEWAAANLKREAAARGIDPARLVFAAFAPLGEHLARHAHADLFLDTLPYNAHATGSHALWAGVPLVTCRGGAMAGRVGASLLTAVGLPELIAESLGDYEALALRLARDTAERAALRAKLEAARETSALFDVARFARHLERAFETMVEIHRGGGKPRAFRVDEIPPPP